MRNSGPLHGKPFVMASSLLALMIFVSCEQPKSTAPAPSAQTQAPATEKVFIVFDGPWAFAPDPKDANSVVAIAPRAKGHRDLLVKASNQSNLGAGTYDLSFPGHTGSAAGTPHPNIAQAKIDTQSLERALDNKGSRYVIRLPKPEEYTVAARFKSRVGATYPPDASTEKDYATAVSLRYNVTSMNGFSLSGTVDSGSFNPLLLQVDTPTIRFIIEPSQDDDPKDKCSTHSRESFRDLTALLALTLYVDFRDDAPNCHSKDPQSVHPAKAQASASSLQRLSTSFASRFAEVRLANPSSRVGALATAIFFFSRPETDCHSPDIILTPGP